MQLIIGMKNLTHHIYTSYLHQAILLLWTDLSIPPKIQHPRESLLSDPSYFQTDLKYYCILYKWPRDKNNSFTQRRKEEMTIVQEQKHMCSLKYQENKKIFCRVPNYPLNLEPLVWWMSKLFVVPITAGLG